jgi:hypothetical protein
MFTKTRVTVLVLLVAVSLCASTASAQGVPETAGKQLQVVIVSVENFDDPFYQNPVLQANIGKATDQLISFFSQRFPVAKITVLRTRDETTSASLSEFFRGTFPVLANGNMMLLFVLSHGEALPFPNPTFGSDLRIVATDTPVNNIAGKSISLSTDVLGNVGGLLPGTFLFGFIDTCHSGAATSIGLSIDAALKSALGVKTMLMASSLSDQLAFQASFTQALVKIWESPITPISTTPGVQNCTVPEVALKGIRDRTQEILGPSIPLGETEGYPTVLIHFQGTMCLETFAAESAIVDIINGTPDTYVVSFTDGSGIQFSEPIGGHDAVPVRLSRTTYNFVIDRNNQPVTKPKNLDLRTVTFDWEPLGAPDSHQLGRALEQGASAAESVRADPTDVENTRKLAFSAYVIASDLASADRIAENMGPGFSTRRNEALKPNQSVQYLQVKSAGSKDLGHAADQLQRFGNLKAAGDYFAQAAAKAKEENSGQAGYFATQAYLAFSAAGESDKAKDMRQTFKVPVQEICTQCKQLEQQANKGDLPAAQFLGNVTTVKVLSNISAADMIARVETAVPKTP